MSKRRVSDEIHVKTPLNYGETPMGWYAEYQPSGVRLCTESNSHGRTVWVDPTGLSIYPVVLSEIEYVLGLFKDWDTHVKSWVITAGYTSKSGTKREAEVGVQFKDEESADRARENMNEDFRMGRAGYNAKRHRINNSGKDAWTTKNILLVREGFTSKNYRDNRPTTLIPKREDQRSKSPMRVKVDRYAENSSQLGRSTRTRESPTRNESPNMPMGKREDSRMDIYRPPQPLLRDNTNPAVPTLQGQPQSRSMLFQIDNKKLFDTRRGSPTPSEQIILTPISLNHGQFDLPPIPDQIDARPSPTNTLQRPVDPRTGKPALHMVYQPDSPSPEPVDPPQPNYTPITSPRVPQQHVSPAIPSSTSLQHNPTPLVNPIPTMPKSILKDLAKYSTWLKPPTQTIDLQPSIPRYIGLTASTLHLSETREKLQHVEDEGGQILAIEELSDEERRCLGFEEVRVIRWNVSEGTRGMWEANRRCVGLPAMG